MCSLRDNSFSALQNIIPPKPEISTAENNHKDFYVDVVIMHLQP